MKLTKSFIVASWVFYNQKLPFEGCVNGLVELTGHKWIFDSKAVKITVASYAFKGSTRVDYLTPYTVYSKHSKHYTCLPVKMQRYLKYVCKFKKHFYIKIEQEA